MKMSIQNFIIIHATNFKLQGCAITNPYLPLEKKIQIPAMKKEWGKQILVKPKLVLKCVYNLLPTTYF